MKQVEFEIPGEPQGKGRPRFAGRIAYTPRKTAEYEQLIREEYARQCGWVFPQGQPLVLRVTAYYKIPKSAGKKKAGLMAEGKVMPTKKPDWDNVGKIVADALNGVAYHDDAQIVDGKVIKRYSGEPRVEVLLKEAEV